MTTQKMHQCNFCKVTKSISEFTPRKNSKLGIYGICKKCKALKANTRRQHQKELDLAEYLLNISCQCCFRRGKPTYKIPPYENITCAWNSAREMLEYCLNYKEFWDSWRYHTSVYAQMGEERYRPSIDRIDSKLGYEPGNIRVATLWQNRREAKAKCSHVLLIKDNIPLYVMEFSSITELKEHLSERFGIAKNTIQLNTGTIQPVGNGISILMQTKNAEIKNAEDYKYDMDGVVFKCIVNEETGKVVAVYGAETFSKRVKGLRLIS